MLNKTQSQLRTEMEKVKMENAKDSPILKK